jgi:hypothetical protein
MAGRASTSFHGVAALRFQVGSIRASSRGPVRRILPKLTKIAATRTPQADIRVGDIEGLPWPDNSFDLVTGFSTFQFADDHGAAVTEARRVGHGPVWVIIPTRLADSGIRQLFAALTALFPPEALPSLKRSGIYVTRVLVSDQRAPARSNS